MYEGTFFNGYGGRKGRLEDQARASLGSTLNTSQVLSTGAISPPTAEVAVTFGLALDPPR